MEKLFLNTRIAAKQAKSRLDKKNYTFEMIFKIDYN